MFSSGRMASRDLPLSQTDVTHSLTDKCKISIMIYNIAHITHNLDDDEVGDRTQSQVISNRR